MMRALITKTLFVLSILLSAQALAFDIGGFSYTVIGATDVEVTGRAAGNTDTDIVIPATVSDGSTTYSVAAIEGGAFFANALTSVSMPGSVTNIEDGAFNSNALTSVIIPDSVTTIGDYSFGNNALTSVTIGNSVTSIGYAAFNNNALISVTIPDSVTSIAGAAFILNALTGVIIPDSVTSIGVEGPISGPPLFGRGFTFANNSLTSAAFKGNSSNFNFNMFSNNSTLATITYCNGTGGWPQGFNNGSTIITTTPVDCSTAPDAPTIDSITAGDRQATVTFTPGADNGSPITGYRYIKDNASLSVDGSLSSAVLLTTDGYAGQIALDVAGNVYFVSIEQVCDIDNLCIETSNVWKVTADGTSSVLGTIDGYVEQIALDAAGNVYAAGGTCGNGGCQNNIWKITANGTSAVLLTTDGYVGQIELDVAGNVYFVSIEQVCDIDNVCIETSNAWKITADGISSVLGTIDGYVEQIALDAAGNVYTTSNGSVCDDFGCIQTSNVWKITPDGTPTILGTIYGSVNQIALDAAGNVYAAGRACGYYGPCIQTSNVWKVTPDGTLTILGTIDGYVKQIALDAAGNVYTAGRACGYYGTCTTGNVWKVTPDGTATNLGSFDITSFEMIALDPAGGNVYASSTEGGCLIDGPCIQTSNVWKVTIASIATYPANGDTSPITITGLSGGTDYLISLIAVNAAGESVTSNPVSIYIPTVAPDAPTIDSIEPGNGQAIITFTPGADNGASITGYTTYCFGDTLAFGESPTSPITVSGLTNGEAYECLVTATNAAGTSLASAASAPFTPAVPPDAPQITGIMAGNGQAIITFTPGADGGSPITGYTTYCYGDTLAFGESPTSPITVFGLTNGQAYVCATTATNNFGTSPASELSAPVTPVAPAPGC